jgi:hypothetical protein
LSWLVAVYVHLGVSSSVGTAAFGNHVSFISMYDPMSLADSRFFFESVVAVEA